MMKMKMENDVKCSSVEVEVRSTTPIDKEKKKRMESDLKEK